MSDKNGLMADLDKRRAEARLGGGEVRAAITRQESLKTSVLLCVEGLFLPPAVDDAIFIDIDTPEALAELKTATDDAP